MKRTQQIGHQASITERIEQCAKAAAAVRSQGKFTAGQAWQRELPLLTTPENVAAYIACVAAGMAQGYIQGFDAKTMMFTAQCALSAFGVQRKK